MIGNRDPRTPTERQLDPARPINNRNGNAEGNSIALPLIVAAAMFAILLFAPGISQNK